MADPMNADRGKHVWRALMWCGWLYFRCENCWRETAMPGLRMRGSRWVKDEVCRG